MSNTRKKKWSKILYEDSGFPDNYIDKESFLEFKQINGIYLRLKFLKILQLN